jgi:hypothetical protein
LLKIAKAGILLFISTQAINSMSNKKKTSLPGTQGGDESSIRRGFGSTEFWLEMLVGGIILVVLGWVALGIIDLKQDSIKAESQIEAIKSDITNLESGLKADINKLKEDLKTYKEEVSGYSRWAASKEVESSIQGAIVTTRPVSNSNGKNAIGINILNFKNYTNTKFFVEADVTETGDIFKQIIRITDSTQKSATSFKTLNNWSYRLDLPILDEIAYDNKTSFTFHSNDKEMEVYIDAFSKLLDTVPGTKCAVYKFSKDDALIKSKKMNFQHLRTILSCDGCDPLKLKANREPIKIIRKF